MVFLHKLFVIFTIVLRAGLKYMFCWGKELLHGHIICSGYPAQKQRLASERVLATSIWVPDWPSAYIPLPTWNHYMGSAQKDFGQEGHELGWRWARSGLARKSRYMLEETKWWALTQCFLFTPGQYLPSLPNPNISQIYFSGHITVSQIWLLLPTVQWHYFNLGCQLILNVEIQNIFLRSHVSACHH